MAIRTMVAAEAQAYLNSGSTAAPLGGERSIMAGSAVVIGPCGQSKGAGLRGPQVGSNCGRRAPNLERAA